MQQSWYVLLQVYFFTGISRIKAKAYKCATQQCLIALLLLGTKKHQPITTAFKLRSRLRAWCISPPTLT